MQLLQTGVLTKFFDAVSSGVANSAPFATPANASVFTWQVSFGSNPSAVSVLIQGSNDNSSWNTVDTSTSTTGEIRTFTSSALFLRARIASITGGSGITVDINSKNNFGTIVAGSVEAGALAIFSGSSGKYLTDLPFPGDASLALLGDGTFGSINNFNSLTINESLIVGAGGNFQYGTVGSGGGDGTYTLSVGPATLTRNGLDSAIPMIISNQDDNSAKTDVYIFSYVNSSTKYAFVELDLGLVNPAFFPGAGVFPFIIGVEGNLADDGTISNQDFYIYDGVNNRNALTITPITATFFGTVTANGVIFPTSDPHVTGAWWNNAGTLTVSAG